MSAQVMQMLTGAWVSRAISVAAKLGIADQLEKGPRGADDLAKAVGAHGPSLHRLLRALASVGFFKEDAGGRFALAPLGDALRSSAPGSARAFAIMMGEEFHWRPWGHLLHSVQTGGTGFEKAMGKPVFEWISANPAAGAVFDQAMTGITTQWAPLIASAYEFGQFKTIADVGGGHGILITAILKANPKLRAVLYDLPHVVEGAKKAIDAAGLTGRCQIAPGDFFKTVPAGAEGYIAKHIIHDWPDDRAGSLLRNIRRAMADNAKLLLVEMVLGTSDDPFPKLLDLEMLVLPGGKERTENEFRTLLAAGGFSLSRIIPTKTPLSIIEALPTGVVGEATRR